VKKLRVLSIQNATNGSQFCARNLPRLVANLPKPKASQKMKGWPFDGVDPIEWEFVGIFSLLGYGDRLDPPKRGDLPVDVQHLRFEKCRAVKGGDRS
jgi:hypothetical protein